MSVFYFLLVGAMVAAQILFFQSPGCGHKAFFNYYWLALNIGLFYLFVAYGISLWGAYICWAQEEEEVIAKEAL